MLTPSGYTGTISDVDPEGYVYVDRDDIPLSVPYDYYELEVIL